MTDALSVEYLLDAVAEIEEAAAWWLANRDKGSLAFREELERVLDLITTEPGAGVLVRDAEREGVRRVTLHRVHYHLYYRVSRAGDTVEVLALWHAKRGTTPHL